MPWRLTPKEPTLISIARSTLIAACTAVALVLAGCAAVDPARIPAIDAGDGSTRLPGKVVWHDLLTEDPAAARRFYGGLFGWSFRDVDIGGGQTYTVIEHNGRGIGGLVDARGINRDANVSRWIPVLSVADMNAAMAEVRAGGGNVFQPPVDIPQRGRVAVIGDPQGAVLTLLEPRTGDPADRPINDGDWLWNEVWSSDPAATIGFYRRLVPEYEAVRVGKDAYTYLKADGQPRFGVLPKPVARIKDTWMAYVRVADPAATATAAERLGGAVLLAPRQNPLAGEVAILNDPSGAGFLVQTWDPSWAQERAANR
jgi:predicted enzyme related to lactoylglutathione lyase